MIDWPSSNQQYKINKYTKYDLASAFDIKGGYCTFNFLDDTLHICCNCHCTTLTAFCYYRTNGICQLFNCYFHSVFSGTPEQSNTENSMEPTDYISSISFKVYDTLVTLDPTKAQGIGLISPKICQTCASILCLPLHHLFTMSLQYAWRCIPSNWKMLVIKLWLKTTGPSNCFPVH